MPNKQFKNNAPAYQGNELRRTPSQAKLFFIQYFVTEVNGRYLK